MGLFKKSKKPGLISDIIRCDEPSYLIWKWHPDGTLPGEHKREYAIRSGSSLRVKDGEVAVFVYRHKDGTMQDFIEGPCDTTLKTANLPILSGIIGTFASGDTPFQAEVYFINLANIIQTKFTIPYFDVCDPRTPDFSVPVRVKGTISFKIADYKEFVKLHRMSGFNLDDFKDQIEDAVSRYVKSSVASAPTTYGIPAIQLEAKTADINEAVENNLRARLKENFGVIVSGVDIGVIEIDKTSPEYGELAAITKEIITAQRFGTVDADIENYAETLRIRREEEQYATHKQSQSANLAAFQIEKQAEVGIAGSDALGKMGSNNAGSINLGDNRGMGFNPAAMMASIALGGVVGQNISSILNNSISQQQAPPPVPKTVYNVVQNGTLTGPYDLEKLSEMAARGEFTRDSLVWKQGMSQWELAGEQEELKGLFPPPIL